MQQTVEAVQAQSVRPVFVDRGRRLNVIKAALLGTDAAMLLAATFAATYLRFETMWARVSFENTSAHVSYYQVSLWLTALWLAALYLERLYDLQRLFWGSGEFSRVARALAVGLVAFILLTFGLKLPGLSRLWTVLAWALAVSCVSLGRLGLRGTLSTLRRRGRLLRPTLVVGSNGEAADITRILSKYAGAGLVPVGCLASSQAERLSLNYCPDDVPCLGAARDLAEIVRSHKIDTVIIASSAFDHEIISRMIAELRGLSVDIHVSSGLFEVLTSRVLVREVCGVPLITVRGVSLSPWNLFVKRAFDLAVSLAIVIVGLPVWLLVMVAIKFDSPGPVFFKQARVGRGGAAFGMYKFRSMVDDADSRLEQLMRDNEADGPLFKMRDDPRVTRVGRWMRKFSIDEFPQLLNVVRGEMSLVGPRPPLIHETNTYSDRHWRRMEVRPGMTGLWQVSGRSALSFEEMVRLDLYYIENWSVGLDMALMLRTVPAVLFAQGAY